MREIKFRGKQLNNGEWAYGGIEFQGEIVYIAQQINGGIACVPVDPETVGQYTGLKDKNGREIYEGDILRSAGGNIFEVQWNDEVSGWYLAKAEGALGLGDAIVASKYILAIIGNIYENPELLIQATKAA